MKVNFSTPLVSRVLWTLAVINIVVIVIMQTIGQTLKPGGIITFEFAGTIENAQQMISSWNKTGAIPDLFFLLGFDYLFMFTYGAFLWLACSRASGWFTGRASVFLQMVALAQPLAALLDAAENFSLYKVASGSDDQIWVSVAYICAVPKFLIVLIGLLSLVSGFVFRLVRK